MPQIADCEAVLPVYGSSMKGVIEPGDLIAIKEIRSRDEFDPTVPYMVITEEHRMVKYLRVDEENQSIIWAESTNHAKIRLAADNIKKVYAIKCVIRFF
jgi:phage repressor protein C with HTH and peptisase S24 domain